MKSPNIASPPAAPVISSDMAFRKHGLSPLQLSYALSFLDSRIIEFIIKIVKVYVVGIIEIGIEGK